MAVKEKDIVVQETEESVAIEHVQKDVVTGTDAQPTSLVDMFDRYTKLILVIDVSGSMSEGMAPEDSVSQYEWTPEVFTKFRGYIKDVMAAELVADDPELSKAEAEKEAVEQMTEGLGLDNDDTLKKYIVDNQLDQTSKIKLQRKYGASNTERKIEAVRGAMQSFVEQRFQKFPDAQVGLFTFDTGTEVKAHPGASKEDVILAVQALGSTHGGTDITQAVKRAMTEFRRRRGMAHHIVLVTDGQDNRASNIKELLPQMKELNVVFDFIFCKGQYEDTYQSGYFKSVVDVIKEVCTATGGEYQECSKASDFRQKFIKACARRALPPACD